MSRSASALSLVCAAALAVGPLSVRSLHAEQKKEYVPNVVRNKLLETPLHGVPGKKVHMVHLAAPPGHVGGKHYHSGPVFVYVLKGTLGVDEEGKPRQTFRAGQVYAEPTGTKMRGFNLSASEPLEILVVQVSSEGQPLMYRAE